MRAQATLPQEPPPPVWTCGPGEPLVCYGEGLAEEPVVVVEGGEGGRGNCEEDGAGGLRCTVWAQGAWTRVVAGGRVLAQRCPCVTFYPWVSR